jgi:hypothetical protein
LLLLLLLPAAAAAALPEKKNKKESEDEEDEVRVPPLSIDPRMSSAGKGGSRTCSCPTKHTPTPSPTQIRSSRRRSLSTTRRGMVTT